MAAGVALNSRAKRGKIEARADIGDSSWTDVFMHDEEEDKNSSDLGKIQLVFITMITLLVYCVAIGDALNTGQRVTSLPATAGTFLILLGLSQGGYLAKKALPASADASPARQQSHRSRTPAGGHA